MEEERLEPFILRGGRVKAEDVLKAISKRQDIRTERHTVIDGDLKVAPYAPYLSEGGEYVVRGYIRIEHNSEIRGSVDFSDVTFNKSMSFNSATFSGDTNFSGATFMFGSVDFRSVTFKENANFKKVTFGGYSDFRSATFNMDAKFSEAVFNRSADFRSATFGSDADFSSATFNSAELSHKTSYTAWAADFSSATFKGNADFDHATFKPDACFNGAKFSLSARFAGAVMDRPVSFADVSFDENTVRAGLKNDILCPIVEWLTRSKIKLSKRPVTSFSEFNTTAVMDGSSNPYLKRYIDDEQWIASWRQRSWWRRTLFILWEFTSHCGRSFTLWMFWALLTAILFGAVYADYTVPSWLPQPVKNLLIRMDPEVRVSPEDRTPTGFTPYYFSIVTFTTLGFGDVKPLNLAGEIWLALEVVLGYIMLGGLISILANKFARRS